ncbi:hypothetical protein [Enterococcus wangshanyuanii]|uniref:Uncharacterized protein n=1 Tax=Enterococcus wangshanyuanii TaxID=2005703 RepID=A0ABQ1NYZ6_9ENTE|nr:hypothetical protein GCM10011573_16660 [Enterococcus wangshanyuanii]
MINPFEEPLEQLSKGEIQTLEVANKDFFVFREAWLKREDKKFFRGEAHLGGNVTYTYDTIVV